MFRIFIVLLFSTIAVHAQKYGTAVGVRFGNNHYGVTARQKLVQKTTLEGIFAVDPDEYLGTLLLERHFPLLGKGLNIYTGAGMHLGEQKETGRFYGYDVVLGAEMKLPALPIVISADIKPAYHINHSDWFAFSTAISAHLILGKESKKKRQKVRERRKHRKERQKRKDERIKSRESDDFHPFDFFKRENKTDNNL